MQFTPHSLRKGTSNAICKLWPPLTTCRPGLAWKSPASTLAHRLAVIHPDIRTRWPERLRTQPVPSTADVRTAPQHAPHTRPTVREKTRNSGCYKQILPHSLDQFEGRAKVLVRTSPRCCRAQRNRLTVFALLIKFQL